MSLADDLNAPPLARRVAEIIRKHAAELELGPDWADAAAVRVLAEVTRRPGIRVVNDLPPLDTEEWAAARIRAALAPQAGDGAR